MPARRTAAALVLALAAAACANAASPAGGDTTARIAHPTDPNALLLRVDTSGGFVAPSVLQGHVPTFSLYGDGRVVTVGAQIDIYPQPALPPVLVRTVDEAGIQRLLAAAIRAGLDHDATYTDLGSVGIADAPTTTFTLAVDGRVHTVEVYALGMDGGGVSTMPAAEARARRLLEALSGDLQDLDRWLPVGDRTADAPFVPDAMAVTVSSYRREQGLHERAIAWPGTTGLASFGEAADGGNGSGLAPQPGGARCGVVRGPDLAALLPLAGRANQLTPWTSDGARWALVLRPLLPDQTNC
jgi:hypothetical protein